MLQQARRVHGMSWGIGLVTTLVIGIAAVIWVSSVRYNNLVDRMHTAVKTVANSSGSVVPLAIENLNVHPQDLIVSHLETRFAGSNENQNSPWPMLWLVGKSRDRFPCQLNQYCTGG